MQTLNRIPTVQENMPRNAKWSCMQLKSFFISARSENTTYRVRERFHPAAHQKEI